MDANTQKPVERRDIFKIEMPERIVSSVRIVEIEMSAGQKAPYHQHPCPVTGQILSGKCLVQIEGEDPKVLETGEAFYEPAETPVVHFDNFSETEPMKFVAYYMTNGENDLIEILPT